MRAPQPGHGRPKQCAQCSSPRIFARGLCARHYSRARRAGVRDNFACRGRSRDEIMVEWELLRSEGYSKGQAAERLGMTLEAFDRAFHRAKAAGDPRALPALVRAPFGTRWEREAA